MIFQSEVVVQKVSPKRINAGLELTILVCGFIGKSTEGEKYIERMKAVPNAVTSEDYLNETIEFKNVLNRSFKIELDFPVRLTELKLLSFKAELFKSLNSWNCVFFLKGLTLRKDISSLDYNRKFILAVG